MLAAVGAEVGALRAVAADELHLAGDRPALLVGDPGRRPARPRAARPRALRRLRARSRSTSSRGRAPRRSACRARRPAAISELPSRRRCGPRHAACRPAASTTSASATGWPAVSLTASRTALAGLARQACRRRRRTSKRFAPGMTRRVEPVRLAGREPDGDLAVAVAVAEQELPGAGAEDLCARRRPRHRPGRSACRRPRTGPAALSGLNSNVRSARIASTQLDVDRRVASVGEGGRHQHVGPAVLERVGDLDVGLLLPRRGDQPQRDASRLDEHPVELGRLIDRRGLDLDPGELQVAELGAPGRTPRAGRSGDRGASGR